MCHFLTIFRIFKDVDAHDSSKQKLWLAKKLQQNNHKRI